MRRIAERLIYRNERGESVEFSTRSQYHVDIKYGVSGLSEIRNALFSFSAIGQDGETFLRNSIESRDIEIVGHIRARDGDLAQNQRQRLIRVMNPHFSATLIYERGGFKRVIPCRVDMAIKFLGKVGFEKFVIQVCSLSPHWREEHEARNEIALWVGNFEFPDDGGGLELRDDEGWEIEFREPSLIVNVENRGDVATGMRIAFRALGIVETPSLLNVNTREFVILDITLEAGDVLAVLTGYGEKAVVLRRGGQESNAFRHLRHGSSYMQLAPGDNLFRFDAEGNLENLEVTIFHDNLYLGV